MQHIYLYPLCACFLALVWCVFHLPVHLFASPTRAIKALTPKLVYCSSLREASQMSQNAGYLLVAAFAAGISKDSPHDFRAAIKRLLLVRIGTVLYPLCPRYFAGLVSHQYTELSASVDCQVGFMKHDDVLQDGLLDLCSAYL